MKRLVYSGLLILVLTLTAAFGMQNKNSHPRKGNGNVMHRGNSNRPIRGNTNRPIRGNSNRPIRGNTNRPIRGNSNSASRRHGTRNKNAAS